MDLPPSRAPQGGLSSEVLGHRFLEGGGGVPLEDRGFMGWSKAGSLRREMERVTDGGGFSGEGPRGGNISRNIASN